ncbi:MAG TPA: hypothetical protein VN689_00730 [Burkholderiales bacterium]|jgi:hypothetical protein|nr:hypothetical protein [Burkholderiales bacterium]
MFATRWWRMSLPRQLQPELLDTLAPHDPRAVRSRRDLRRINRFMATASLLGAPLDGILRDSAVVRLVELGSGDGEMLLQIARRHARRWPKVSVELLDAQPVVSAQTLSSYRALGFNVQVTRADVFDWLARPAYDGHPVIIANLFMHHFEGERLSVLLGGIAARASAFLCCEPRRSRLALTGSRLLGLIGCNAVTRHDAVASVRAGFSARELSTLWPQPAAWSLREGPAGFFSHRFQAVRV